MATKVILEARVREEAVDEAKAFFKGKWPEALTTKGRLHSYVLQNDKEPNLLVLIEDWESEEHHRKYLKACIKTGRLRQLIRLLSGPPSLRYFITLQ